MEAYVAPRVDEAFTASWERFGSVLAFLSGAESAVLTHAELEQRLRRNSDLSHVCGSVPGGAGNSLRAW